MRLAFVILGIASGLLISLERTFGQSLDLRKPQLPFTSRVSLWYIFGLCTTYYFDRLLGAVLDGITEKGDILYPLSSIVVIVGVAYYCMMKGAAHVQNADGSVVQQHHTE